MCVHLHVSGDACFHLTVLFLVCLYNKAFLITTHSLVVCYFLPTSDSLLHEKLGLFAAGNTSPNNYTVKPQ
ncbi:hypothetical protein V5799_015609 [Amblyomma americanum]|uniref:Uncharacterized protein n=1 Tax=Amblyomma americanum TaxID=6943 RepID=A0AAQ4F889_AMBAM